MRPFTYNPKPCIHSLGNAPTMPNRSLSRMGLALHTLHTPTTPRRP